MKEIRKYLIKSLRGQGAHISIETALKGFPFNRVGEKIDGLEHSVWMLLYHIWICTYDIVEFSIHAGHESPEYPSGYWPEKCCPETEKVWKKLIEDTQHEIDRMVELLEDESNDITALFPWGSGQNLFREALILIDHNSYHIAQVIDLRALLGVPVKDW